MKLIAIILSTLIISGCASTQIPETVNVPIAVPCKTETPNKPTLRFNPPYDNLFEAVRDLLGDREVSIGYEKELEAALRSCK